MIEQQETIIISYDNESKTRIIKLNPDERFIKEFTDFTMDVTVVEILPKDNISDDYLKLTPTEHMDNLDKLIGKEITIVQYPKGKLHYSDGNIKRIIHNGKQMTPHKKYEFTHSASTEDGSSGSPIFLKGLQK